MSVVSSCKICINVSDDGWVAQSWTELCPPPPPTAAVRWMGLQPDLGRGGPMPDLAAAERAKEVAASTEQQHERRQRVELAQEAVEQQRILEMGVEAKRIIEMGVEDLSSRNLLKLFEIADANIEVKNYLV